MVLCHEDCIVPIVKVLRKFKNQGTKTPLLHTFTICPTPRRRHTKHRSPQRPKTLKPQALLHFTFGRLRVWRCDLVTETGPGEKPEKKEKKGKKDKQKEAEAHMAHQTVEEHIEMWSVPSGVK